MTTQEDSEQSLEEQLELLRRFSVADGARRIEQDLAMHTRRRRREVVLSLSGAAVAAVATAVFVSQGDPIGYVVLGLVTLVMLFVAWKSANRAASLANLKSGQSMLSHWRQELHRQVRHAMYSAIEAGLFAVLAGRVIWQHGLPDWKSLIFLAVAVGVCIFAAYQNLVVSPALKRELAMLGPGE